jgi:hypothetical protein
MLADLRRQRQEVRTSSLTREEIAAIQEELAGFIYREVCSKKGEFYDKENMTDV